MLQDCEYCTKSDEYAIYAFPGPLLQYIREALVVGLLTINGSFRDKWRTYSLAAIVCAAIVEGYWTMTAEIKIPRDGLGTLMVRSLRLSMLSTCFSETSFVACCYVDGYFSSSTTHFGPSVTYSLSSSLSSFTTSHPPRLPTPLLNLSRHTRTSRRLSSDSHLSNTYAALSCGIRSSELRLLNGGTTNVSVARG